MKPSHEVNQVSLLREIWEAFRHEFETLMDAEMAKGVDPGGSGRLDAEIIFNSLECCKPVIAKHFDCRKEILFARAVPLAGTTWKTQSKEEYGWGMQEYLLDFSISHGAIPVVIGQHPTPAFQGNEKFELMLGAESEMGSEIEITRDLLKLLDTKCRVKVLVCGARTKKAWIENLKRQIEFVFNNHASDPTADAWLIIGVPTYPQWVNFAHNRTQTPRQLYLLMKEGLDFALEDKIDWWP